MKLEELYLDGFGHFFQRTFTLGGGGVTVFHGPNEAGKSTLLAFIRTVLFGFPSRNRDDHFAPLAGGRHGGRIQLTTDGGERHALERYAGPRGGPITLVDDAGMPLDAGLMLPRITGQSTPAVFSNVFAFSIDELQQMGLLEDASISDAIYSAGQGVPGLAGFSRSLAARQDRIFLATGRAQEVPNLARAIREVDEQLKTVAGNAGRYGSLTARRSEIDAGLAALDMDRSRLNVKSTELRTLLEACDDWVELHACSARLESLPRYAQFPVDAIPRLEAFQDGVKRTTDDVDEAGEQLRLA
ncbi:MAG: AAA family ATPase, partial [Chloroflexi bacterium]|nr:AAA family ATPase [Chloroflexota bacterium]